MKRRAEGGTGLDIKSTTGPQSLLPKYPFYRIHTFIVQNTHIHRRPWSARVVCEWKKERDALVSLHAADEEQVTRYYMADLGWLTPGARKTSQNTHTHTRTREIKDALSACPLFTPCFPQSSPPAGCFPHSFLCSDSPLLAFGDCRLLAGGAGWQAGQNKGKGFNISKMAGWW